MIKDKNGTLWISPPEGQLEIEKEKLSHVLEEFSKTDVKYTVATSWASDVGDRADALLKEICKNLKKKYSVKGIVIDFSNPVQYPHDDSKSIPWAVFDKLLDAWPDNLCREELPLLRNFLNTPAGKELEAWEKWEAYWEERDGGTNKKSKGK